MQLSYVRDDIFQYKRNKKQEEGRLTSGSIVTGFVSILRLKVNGRRLTRTCIVFKDALGAEPYRQLLVLLRNHLTG